MPIIKQVHNAENPFVQILRETIRDNNLSWKARGLLAYLLSLPDNWNLSAKHLATQAPDGRDSLKSAIDELENNKYLVKSKIRNEKGHFIDWKYFIHEKPYEGSVRPKTENPTSECPNSESRHPKNNVYKEKCLNKNIKESKPKKAEHSSLASDDAHASPQFLILEEIVNMLLTSIISLRPSFKISDDLLHKWHLEIDRMIRLDSREIEEMKQVLEWLPSNDFWNTNILSATKFRKQYDKLCIEMEKAKNDESKYKIFAFKAKKHCNLNNLNISNLGVYDKYSKFDLSYKMPYEDFCRCLAKQYNITNYEGDM